jgi:hypothetical protein
MVWCISIEKIPSFTGNTRNLPVGLWQTIRSANPAWISLPSGHSLSHTHTLSLSLCNSVQCGLNANICIFYVGTIQRIYLSSDDSCSDSTPVLGLICVEIFMFCLSSRRWFVLCLACIHSLGASTGVWRWELALSIGPN